MRTVEEGAWAEVRFTGPTVRWIGARHFSYGIARVFLNGVDQGTVDLYSPGGEYQQVLFEAAGLGEGVHTLRIVHTGEANPSASNSRVEVDAVEAERLCSGPGGISCLIWADF